MSTQSRIYSPCFQGAFTDESCGSYFWMLLSFQASPLTKKKCSVIIGSSSDLSSLGEEITYLYYVIQPSALWSLTRKGERTHLCFVEWTECKHVKLCYDSFLSWGLQKAEKGKIQRKREKWVRHADNPQSMYPQGSL